MGGGTKSLHPSVVELDGLYHALSLSYYVYSSFCCLFPNRVWKIRASGSGTTELAFIRPDHGVGGTFCRRERIQFRTSYISLSSRPVFRTFADISWLYAYWYSKVYADIFPRSHVFRLWSESVILVLHTERWRKPILILHVRDLLSMGGHGVTFLLTFLCLPNSNERFTKRNCYIKHEHWV